MHRRVEWVQFDLDRAPAPAPGKIETGVDGQAVQPRIEPVGVAEAPQVAPGADQCLLDRVAGELRVPKDQASGRVQPREGRVDEFGEGVMIAPLRASDELSLVHGRLDCGTTWMVVLDRVWRLAAPKGSFVRRRGRQTLARSLRIRCAASFPGAPITHPPGWVPEPHW